MDKAKFKALKECFMYDDRLYQKNQTQEPTKAVESDEVRSQPDLNEKEYVGFPSLGSVKLTDHAYDMLTKHHTSHYDLIKTYVPDAHVTSGTSEDDRFLPSFSIGEWDLSVEYNHHNDGPRWGRSSQRLFDYVLLAETTKGTLPVLYGNSASLLVWAAIYFVYADYDRKGFCNTFFPFVVLERNLIQT